MSVTQMTVRFPLVLDYLFAKYFGSVSVDDCAQTENLDNPYEAVSGPGIEPLRMGYTDSQFGHNRHPKCMRKLPLELHFLVFTFLPS